MLIGIGNAGVVLLAELIVRGLRVRVATKPEVLDELLTLLVVLQAFERLHFLVRDDPDDVLVQPFLPWAVTLQLTAQIFLLLNLFAIRETTLRRVRLFIGRLPFHDFAVWIFGRCGRRLCARLCSHGRGSRHDNSQKHHGGAF